MLICGGLRVASGLIGGLELLDLRLGSLHPGTDGLERFHSSLDLGPPPADSLMPEFGGFQTPDSRFGVLQGFPIEAQLLQNLHVPGPGRHQGLSGPPGILQALGRLLCGLQAIGKGPGVRHLGLKLAQKAHFLVLVVPQLRGLLGFLLCLLGELLDEGFVALGNPQGRFVFLYGCLQLLGLLPQDHVIVPKLVFPGGLLTQHLDALLGGGDLLPLLLGVRLDGLAHPVVDVQAQQGAQDLHAAVAVGVQEQAIGVLPDKGDGTEGITVHAQQPDDLRLGQLHGGVALIGPFLSLGVEALEGQGPAPGLGPGTDHPVGLAAHVEGEGDGPALGPVPDPAADVLLPRLLIEAVGNRVHEQGGLAHAVPAIDHSHVYRLKIEKGVGIAPIIPH